MKKIKLNKDSISNAWRWYSRTLKLRLKQLILLRHLWIERIVALVGLVVVVILVAYLAWFEVVVTEPVADSIRLKLKTEIIDELEFWIEDRHAIRVKGMSVKEGLWLE